MRDSLFLVVYGLAIKNERLIEFQAAGIPKIVHEGEVDTKYSQIEQSINDPLWQSKVYHKPSKVTDEQNYLVVYTN